ncbi:MAG: putative cysteine ligase BshC [Gemmatimonadales bacterium]|nr:MAG: putative cysteine ligase BshC [Gemmatimonadales bacterium]
MTLRFEPTPFAEKAVLDFRPLASRLKRAVDPRLKSACSASGRAAENLELLFSGDVLCVTTGQQPGLFTGPLYTVYKALTAAAAAQILSERLRTPVVPVFWVAGDDHDFAEANHTYLLTVANEIERLTLRVRSPEAPLTPLYRETLGAEVEELLERITELTPATEFRPAVLEWLGRHYRPESDLAGAFSGALAELLAEFGVVVFRPTDREAKRAMVPFFIRQLEMAPELDRALAEHRDLLRSRGLDTPIEVGDGASTVMLECRLGRDRLILEDGHYVARRGGERWSLDELIGLVEREPERFSPNVLARPVIEAALFPTLAYVAGPAEYAYLRQCEPLYRALGVERQTPIARWSGRVVEKRVAKVLEKYGIGAEDLRLPEGQLEAQLVRDEMPEQARAALNQLRAVLEREYGRLAEAVKEIDPTLVKPVESARNEALVASRELEKKIVHHLKQKHEILVSQLAKARNNLFPLGKPQERVLNVIPYLVRYGREFLGEAFAACKTHALATLGGDP